MGKSEVTVKDIKDTLEAIVPAELAEDWDNGGLLLGFEDRQVSRILTCLEVNMSIVEEAINRGAEMIVSHHPLIFGGLNSLNASTPKGAVIIRLIRHGISVYSSHTAFDKVNGGNNDALAGILGLKNITDLSGSQLPSTNKMLANPSEFHIGRIGELKKSLKLSQVVDFLCEGLNIPLSQVSVVGNLDTDIKKIGLCTGAGSEFITLAASKGCQVFITGDVKYHAAQDAKDIGMCVIDAGHYGTEKLFSAVMKVQLEKVLDKKVEVLATETDINPFTVI